jgi:hypothetical protein
MLNLGKLKRCIVKSTIFLLVLATVSLSPDITHGILKVI